MLKCSKTSINSIAYLFELCKSYPHFRFNRVETLINLRVSIGD